MFALIIVPPVENRQPISTEVAARIEPIIKLDEPVRRKERDKKKK